MGGVFAFQRKAVHQQVDGVAVLGVEGAALFLGDDADGRFHFGIGDAVVAVAAAQILGKVVAQHHLVKVAT